MLLAIAVLTTEVSIHCRQNEASQRNNVRWAAPPEKGPEVNVSGRGSQWKFRCSTKVFVAFISFKSITNQNRKH